MKDEETFFLIEPGPRPAFSELAAYLWGADADIDSDGDSGHPEDSHWTELTLTLRPTPGPRVDIDPTSVEPLVLKIASHTPGLAEKAAFFLQQHSGGVISSKPPVIDPTAAGYDALAQEYANHLFFELEKKPFDRDFLDRFSGLLPAGEVLDVGCGPGHIGRYVARHGRVVSGVDISERMIACARELNPDMRFSVGDMRALPFPSASFAGLIAFYSIIHLDRDELPAVFAELKRLLAPGGALALAFHVGQEVRHIEELWGVKTCLDFVFFETATVTAALSTAGFEILECTCRGPYDAAVEAQTERCYLVAR